MNISSDPTAAGVNSNLIIPDQEAQQPRQLQRTARVVNDRCIVILCMGIVFVAHQLTIHSERFNYFNLNLAEAGLYAIGLNWTILLIYSMIHRE